MEEKYLCTSIKIGLSRVFSITFFSVCCSGCATESKVEPSNSNSDLFIDPSKRVGESVIVRGVLHWRFEDRSLYPSERDVGDDRSCLPILIRSKNKDMIEKAKKRDGTTVEVNGKLVLAARPGMVSVTTCKPAGVEINSIR